MKFIKTEEEFENAKRDDCMIVFLPDDEIDEYLEKGVLNQISEDTSDWKFYVAYAHSLIDVCVKEEIMQLPAIYTWCDGEGYTSGDLCEGEELADNIADWYADEAE